MTLVPYLPEAGLTLGGEMGCEQTQGTWNPALQIQMPPARPGRLLACEGVMMGAPNGWMDVAFDQSWGDSGHSFPGSQVTQHLWDCLIPRKS